MEPKEEKSKIKSDILTRVRVLYLLFILLGLIIFVRLVWVQFLSRENRINSQRIEGRIFRDEPLKARRGAILSRSGEELATSIFRYRILMNMAAEGFDSLELFHEQSDSLAELLALHFRDRTTEEYRQFFRREHAKRYRLVYRKDTTYRNSTTWLGRLVDYLRGEEAEITRPLYDTLRDERLIEIFPREVDYAEWQELKRYPILNYNLGMSYREEKIDRRVYPQGELARRTIGRNDDRGQYGIEAIFSEVLSGEDGQERRQRIARGFSGRVAGYAGNIDPIDGLDVVTTLDPDIQDVADKALRQQLSRQNALWGTTLVMECATGDLLAMANLGRRNDGSYGELENYALGRRMEPGSTFKLAALLALLEDCGKDLSLSYDSGNGESVMVGRARVTDAHEGYSEVDLKTATAQSLNVFYAKAIYEAYRENPERYIAFLKHLHLDRPMGLEAFGERTPLLPEPGQKGWYPHVTLPNLGYGYAIELTPLQILVLYNAVANKGRMVAPRLIREIQRQGQSVEAFPPKVLVEQICSEGTLALVRECLEEVALSGTAKYYFGDTTRYRVGAKTGTAKFAQGDIHYTDGYYLGTMVTYLPADNPQYTLLTALFTRQGNGSTIYGAGLAGPVQQRVATYLSARIERNEEEAPNAEALPTALKGGDLREVRRVADHYDLELTLPAKQGWGRANCEDGEARIELIEGGDTIPDLRGMGLKDALYLLERLGLQVTFTGHGRVLSQTPAPGRVAQKGSGATLRLE